MPNVDFLPLDGKTSISCPHCENWQIDYSNEAVLDGFEPSAAAKAKARQDLLAYQRAVADEQAVFAQEVVNAILEEHAAECPSWPDDERNIVECPEGCGPQAIGKCPHPIVGPNRTIIARGAWEQIVQDFQQLVAENLDSNERLDKAKQEINRHVAALRGAEAALDTAKADRDEALRCHAAATARIDALLEEVARLRLGEAKADVEAKLDEHERGDVAAG